MVGKQRETLGFWPATPTMSIRATTTNQDPWNLPEGQGFAADDIWINYKTPVSDLRLPAHVGLGQDAVSGGRRPRSLSTIQCDAKCRSTRGTRQPGHQKATDIPVVAVQPFGEAELSPHPTPDTNPPCLGPLAAGGITSLEPWTAGDKGFLNRAAR